MLKKKNAKKDDYKKSYKEEINRYNKLYKVYLFKYLRMNNYELKRERFLCEKEIRTQSLFSDNGRIAIVLSFFAVFTTVLLNLIESIANLNNIILDVIFNTIFSFFLIGSLIYLLNYGSDSQNKKRSKMERYYLKISVIDEILSKRNKTNDKQ